MGREMNKMKRKLSESQRKLLVNDGIYFYYNLLSERSKKEYITAVPLRRNHRSAYILEELNLGKVCCISPFDCSFFLRRREVDIYKTYY